MSVAGQYRTGSAWGLPIMKFVLTYRGDLPSTGNGGDLKKRRRKWEIRKEIAPQLEELWRVHPALRETLKGRLIPKQAKFLMQEQHHSNAISVRDIASSQRGYENMDLCEEIQRAGRSFFPLVRNTLALQCALKILFLRPEPTGRVVYGGDIDGRIKTLLDALSVPVNADHVFEDDTVNDPIFCLLEDDALVSRIDIETQRLLTPPTPGKSPVELVVEVDIRVTDSRSYNHPFLGD